MDKAEEIISGLFNGNLKNESTRYSEIYREWKRILENGRLSDHCRIVDMGSGVLTVSFDHPGWIQVFRMNQSRILKNLNRYTVGEEITSVRMIMKGDVSRLPPKTTEKPAAGTLADRKEEGSGQYEGKFESIQDDDLKKQLENLKKKLQGK